MNKLKPCPFCGGEDVSSVRFVGMFFVRCENCRARSGMSEYMEEAAELWNGRKATGQNRGKSRAKKVQKKQPSH